MLDWLWCETSQVVNNIDYYMNHTSLITTMVQKLINVLDVVKAVGPFDGPTTVIAAQTE